MDHSLHTNMNTPQPSMDPSGPRPPVMGSTAMDHASMGHAPMDHNAADIPEMVHSGHGGDTVMMAHSMGGMAMYFHGGCNETILFEFWKIDSVGGLVGSMIGCILLAVIYEGLKFYREHLFRQNFRPATGYARASSGGRERGGGGDADGNAPSSATEVDAVSITAPSSMSASVGALETSMWSCGHFTLTLLHLVQVTLAYLLMLIFMTYNTWLCGAVVVGAAVGYFLFGWRKTIVYEESDHCH